VVVRGPAYPPATKLMALTNMEASRASSDQSKSSVALAALTAGWNVNTSNTRQQRDLATMRKTAIDMIGRYKTSDSTVYQQLVNSYERGIDLEEKLAAIKTLEALKTDDAAAKMNGFLSDLNKEQKAGALRAEGNNLVRALIPAIGAVGKSSSQAELKLVAASNWPSAVNTLAQDALRQLR
jgi:hypothetical protein